MNKLTLLYLLGVASAGNIVLDVFPFLGCGGKSLGHIQADNTKSFDSSGCKAGKQFSSARVASGDPGFQCNIYSDSNCKNFVAVARPAPPVSLVGILPSTVDTCLHVIGNSVQCFNNDLFTNPFADSTATVSLGKALITVDDNGDNLVQGGIEASCSETACGTATIFTRPMDHFNQRCKFTTTISGTFVNANQRDYMAALLKTAFDKTVSNTRVDTKGSSIGNNVVNDIMNEASVVIRDKNSAIQAQMDVILAVNCAPPSPKDCKSFLDLVTKAALKAVPTVGGLLAAGFDLVC